MHPIRLLAQALFIACSLSAAALAQPVKLGAGT